MFPYSHCAIWWNRHRLSKQVKIREWNSATINDLHLQIGRETSSALPTSYSTHCDRNLQGSIHNKIGNVDLETEGHGDSTLWKYMHFSREVYILASEIILGTVVIIRPFLLYFIFIYLFQRKTSIWYGLQYCMRIDLNTCFLRKVLCLQSFVEWLVPLLLISTENWLLKETTQLIQNTTTSFMPT